MCELKYLFLLLFVVKVNSMAIKGPVLTRYDPCGLGSLHFDRIGEKFWQGVVNLGLYTNLTQDVEIDVTFEKQMKIEGASHNSTFKVRKNKHNFVFKPKGDVPSRYVFYIRIEEDGPDVPSVKKFSLNNLTLCDDAIKASQTVESFNVTDNTNYYRHVCGRRSLNNAELTSVRTDAKAGDWPWHVAIFVKYYNANVTRYECGGNIISRTAIVTAAHCVSKLGIIAPPETITIVAGVSNRTDLHEIGRQEFIAEKVIVHPNYNGAQATSDLAIIKISKLQFTDYVQPICIWGPVYDKTNLYGYQATVVGYGAKEDNKLSEVLRSTYTLVQNDSTCIEYSPMLYGALLNEFTFCAGYGPTAGINPRNGDSGGGLVVPTMQADHKISWFLRGVLSKCGVAIGHTECDPTFYVVYTDVGPHYGWLYHHSGLKYKDNILY